MSFLTRYNISSNRPNDCTSVSDIVANADTRSVGRSVSEAGQRSETVQAGPQRRQEPEQPGRRRRSHVEIIGRFLERKVVTENVGDLVRVCIK